MTSAASDVKTSSSSNSTRVDCKRAGQNVWLVKASFFCKSFVKNKGNCIVYVTTW